MEASKPGPSPSIHDIKWTKADHKWPGLNSVVMVESTREMRDKTERGTRFCISSPMLPASQVGPAIRDHWAIENSPHWVMDMVFRNDECRLRTDHTPANFTTFQHMARNLLRRATTKDSIHLSRKVAAWDDEFVAGLIAA